MKNADATLWIEHRIRWDEAKATANLRKHGVPFEQAKAMLGDPLAISRHDHRHDGTEERWFTIGCADGAMLTAVHTYDESEHSGVYIRIISARRPTPDERRQYETGKYRIEEAAMNKSDPSQFVRGRFYRENAVFIGPVNVDEDLEARISKMATASGTTPSALANELLRRALAEIASGTGPEATKAQTSA